MANELKPYVQRVNPDDEAVNQIITILKKTLPDNGAFFIDGKPTTNLVDYVSLIIGLGAAAVTRGASDDVVNLVVSGVSFKLDTLSNFTSSDPTKLDNIADGIAASLTAVGVGLGVTILTAGFSTIGAAVGGVAVGFFVGNLASGYINDLGDYWLGSVIQPSFDIETHYMVFPTNSLFEYAIRD